MWQFIEFLILSIGFIGFTIEILIPVFMDKPIFPSFRKKKKKNIDEVIDELKTTVEVEEKETESMIEESKEKLSKSKEKLNRVKSIKTKTNEL